MEVLDIVIGLVFIFLLYSLLATIILEIISVKLSFRSKVLEKAIIRMLEDGKASSSYRYLDRVKGYFNLFFRTNSLKGKNLAPWFYAHPLIKYLAEDNYYNKPAYIKAQNFSKVMMDLLKGFTQSEKSEVQRISDSISKGVINHLPIDLKADHNHPAISAIQHQLGSNRQNLTDPGTTAINPDTKLFLSSIWLEAKGDTEMFKAKLETWFDDTMERTTGWYKRYTKFILFSIGLILAVSFNIDTIKIAKKLSVDPKLRAQIVQSASEFLKQNQQVANQQTPQIAISTNPNAQKVADSLRLRSAKLMDSATRLVQKEILSTNQLMGLGWKKNKFGKCTFEANDQDWTAIIGWLITALAISLGAPFWFDLLSKLMRIRGSNAEQTDSGKAQEKNAATAISVNVNNNQNGEEAVG